MFSDYIIYFDESGSPNLNDVYENYPIFVLACICVKKDHYANVIVPKLQSLKFKYFGHDQIIFHERDIRHQAKDFAIFRTDASLRQAFLDEITKIIKGMELKPIVTIVDKKKLLSNTQNHAHLMNCAFSLR